MMNSVSAVGTIAFHDVPPGIGAGPDFGNPWVWDGMVGSSKKGIVPKAPGARINAFMLFFPLNKVAAPSPPGQGGASRGVSSPRLCWRFFNGGAPWKGWSAGGMTHSERKWRHNSAVSREEKARLMAVCMKNPQQKLPSPHFAFRMGKGFTPRDSFGVRAFRSKNVTPVEHALWSTSARFPRT